MSIYTNVAKRTAEQYILHNEVLPLAHETPAELMVQRACYVYIMENPGKWPRAAYGEPLPRQPSLAQEISTNTLQAITNTMARPLRRAELSSLVYAVALLEPLQRISDPEHLDPSVFGLFVQSSKGKQTLIMPHRPGIETARDQIATAMREARINTREEVTTLYRFRVAYYEA